MAKTKSKQKKKQQPKSRRPAVTRSLDPYAYAHARLLVDPCGAPLCHPVYPGGDAGFLFRADCVLTFGGGATDTAGFVHWTPGYVNNSNSELVVGAAAAGSTAIVAASQGNGPGKAFLAANAAGVRCVAACAKVTYPGTESSRSGRLHYGHTQGSTVDVGDSIPVDSIAPLMQHFTRTPPEIVEVLWRPGIADTEFNDPTANSNATLRDRKSSITLAWAGIPVNTGMTVHFTAVYEWVPRINTGLANNVAGKSQSRNTMDDVLDALVRSGFTFVRNAAGAAGSSMAMGALTTISNAFGLMPARPRGRSYLTFGN